MFPWLVIDQNPAGKQKMGHASYFEPNVFRRAGFGLVPSRGLMDVQPQATQALQPRGIARLRQVDGGGHGKRGLGDGLSGRWSASSLLPKAYLTGAGRAT